jgi:hypothetical protein
MLQCMSPLVTRLRHAAMSELSPLSGEEQKSNFGAARSVDDPQPTSAAHFAVMHRATTHGAVFVDVPEGQIRSRPGATFSTPQAVRFGLTIRGTRGWGLVVFCLFV